MNKDELLAALTAERYDNRWWSDETRRAESEVCDDSDVATARRRRQMAEDFERASDRRAG